jgi:hypothetical protein
MYTNSVLLNKIHLTLKTTDETALPFGLTTHLILEEQQGLL